MCKTKVFYGIEKFKPCKLFCKVLSHLFCLSYPLRFMVFLQQALCVLRNFKYLEACFQNLSSYLNANERDQGLLYSFPLAKESAHANNVDQVIPRRVPICSCYRLKITNTNGDQLELLWDFNKQTVLCFLCVSVISCSKSNEYKLKGILEVWNIFDFSIKMNLLLAIICLYLKHTFEVLTNSVVIQCFKFIHSVILWLPCHW